MPIERLKASNIWHPKYDLPLSPQNNNPWFYMALSFRVIDNETDYSTCEARDIYLEACEKEPGLFHRWPNHDLPGGAADDVTSHDELIGIAYISPYAAQRIWKYLKDHWGNYNNTKFRPKIPFSYNLFRFVWFVQFIRSRAGIELSKFSQWLWAVHVRFDAWKTKRGTDDASGRELIWVMAKEMCRWPLCKEAYKDWCQSMKEKGITPKYALTLEPKQNPVLVELAPEEF